MLIHKYTRMGNRLQRRLSRFLGIILVALAACPPAAHQSEAATARGPTLRASAVLLPAELGVIQSRYDGQQGRPVVFVIGESHSPLGVQQAVAHILGYLRGAYSLKLVGFEGYDKPLNPHTGLPLIPARAAAAADLAGRRFGGVEFAVLAYPDLRVFGVSDMNAYRIHGEALLKAKKDHEQWIEDFREFLTRLSSIQVTPGENTNLNACQQQFQTSRDLESLLTCMHKVFEKRPPLASQLQSLRARWKELTDLTKPENPMMYARDVAMARNTLLLTAGGEKAVALVVGKLHLPGIERELRKVGAAYVSILPAGVDEPLTDEDLRIYDEWKQGTPSRFEAWVDQHRPVSPLTRPAFVRRNLIVGSLGYAAQLWRVGHPANSIDASLTKAKIEELRITSIFDVPGAIGIEFSYQGKRAYIYFGARSEAIESREATKLDEGPFGHERYVIYDGSGGGRRPPLPPAPPPAPDSPDDFGDGQLYRDAVEARQPSTIIFYLRVEADGTVVRQINLQKTALAVSATELEQAAKRFRNLPPGPEQAQLAQQLATSLFSDLSQVELDDVTSIQFIATNDFLSGISLPYIAELAGEEEHESIRRIPDIYTIPWSARNNLPSLVSEMPNVVEIEKTVVCFSDALRTLPIYSDIVAAIVATRARVNVLPEVGDTLLMVGDSTDQWTLTLEDGSKVTPSSPRFTEALTRSREVIKFNLPISADLEALIKVSRTHTLSQNLLLPAVRYTVEAIREGNGQISLDAAVRRKARETAQAREEMVHKDLLENLGRDVEKQVALEMEQTTTKRSLV